MLAPPPKLLGGGGLAPPGPPSSYAYAYAVTKIQCASNPHCLDGHKVVGSLDILLLIKLEASHLFEIFSLTIALIVIHFKVAMVENYMQRDLFMQNAPRCRIYYSECNSICC